MAAADDSRRSPVVDTRGRPRPWATFRVAAIGQPPEKAAPVNAAPGSHRPGVSVGLGGRPLTGCILTNLFLQYIITDREL